MALTKLYLSEEEVSLEVNLKELFGRTVPDESLREVIADDIIEIVIARTNRGFGVENLKQVKFKKYSKAYKQRTGKTTVDLDESGGMLNALHLIDSSSSKLIIGIDDEKAPQAHGHMTGQYGEGPLPRRSFLGLTEQDLRRIKSRYKGEVQKLSKLTAKDFLSQRSDEKLGITKDDVSDALAALKIRGIF